MKNKRPFGFCDTLLSVCAVVVALAAGCWIVLCNRHPLLLGDKPLPHTGAPSATPTPLPPLIVEAPIHSKVPLDPTQVFPGIASGTLAYTFDGNEEYAEESIRCYLTVRRVQKQGSGSGSGNASIITYPLRVKGEADDPQFSPDGRYVLVKIGSTTTSYDHFQFYMFDTQTGKARAASPNSISYRKVQWSPDGKYLSYIGGGDAEGGTSQYAPGPLQLIACNWRIGEDQGVAEGDGLAPTVAWLDSDELVYSRSFFLHTKSKPSTQSQTERTDGNGNVLIETRPNIYVYSTKNYKTRLLIKDGQHPVASPDGQHIVFFGSENPRKPFPLNDDWSIRASGVALSVVNRDGSNRHALDVREGFYPDIVWLPDSRSFLTVTQVQGSPHNTFKIEEWNVPTRQSKVVTTLAAEDFQQISRAWDETAIYPLRVSADCKTLYVIAQQYVEKDAGGLEAQTSLQAVNLQTGRVSTVLKSKYLEGLDWREP